MIFRQGRRGLSLNRRIHCFNTLLFFFFPSRSNVLARLAVIAMWAKLSKIYNNKAQTFKLYLLFNRNFQGMCCGSGERIRAVQNHVSSSQKCDCHYYYHTSSKNSGNESFHLQLPISAMETERAPLVCKPMNRSSVFCGSIDLHVCKDTDTECTCC